MSTMDIYWRIQRNDKRPLQSVIEVKTTDNIYKVIKKVFDENEAVLSAKAAAELVAKHWELRQDKTIHNIEENDLEEVVTEVQAKNYRLVIEDAPPSVAQVVVRDPAIEELVKIVQRVLFQPAVEIRGLNSFEHFEARQYRTLNDLFSQTYERFEVDVTQLSDQRFYWLPALGEGATTTQILAGRRTLRNEADWESFLEMWSLSHDSKLIVLYFVRGELSPSMALRPLPPSPPRMPLDYDDQKSEPNSVRGLNERDRQHCVVCHHTDHVEAAHIIDQHRSDLLQGAPDAPRINDLRNFILLCPNHHTSFDRYEWTLVQDKMSLKFWLRTTPMLQALSADLSACSQREISFNDPCPPAYLFLLKQLGRFEIPCLVCHLPFSGAGMLKHCNAQHKDKKSEWEGKPFSLPIIPGCSCTNRGGTTWELYCHLVEHHSVLLYS